MIKIETLEKILIFLAAVAVLCLRPSVVGEVYSTLSCALLAAVTVALFIVALHLQRPLVLEKYSALQLSVLVFIFYYVLLKAVIFMPTYNSVTEFKALFIFLSLAAAALLLLSNRRYATMFFDYFCIILIASCASVVISAMLFVVGFQSYQITYAHLTYTYSTGGDIAFPFTFIFPSATTWLGPIPRMSGIFREPGVFPVYACWAAAYAFQRGWILPISLVCLFSAIVCLSSIGAPLAFYTGAMILLLRVGFRPIPALLTIVVLGLLTWQAVYYSEYFGIAAKINSGSGSFEERQYLAAAALDAQDLIFGDGFGFSIFTTGPISLVAAIRVFGLVYYSAFILTYILAAAANFRFWLIGLVPAIATVMVAQPVFREPAFIILMLSVAVFVPPPQRKAATRSATPAPGMAATGRS